MDNEQHHSLALIEAAEKWRQDEMFREHLEHCRACNEPIETAELCDECAEGNDPFPAASKWRDK